jgi:O-antigen/teichoic acid export membrane protein
MTTPALKAGSAREGVAERREAVDVALDLTRPAHRRIGLRRGGDRRVTGRGVGERRSLAGSFAATLVIQGLNVMTGVLLARQLAPEGRGELAAIILWPALIAAVGSFGLTEAVAVEVAASRDRLGAVLGSSLLALALQTVVLTAVGAAAIPVALHDYDREVVVTALLYLVYIPLFLVSGYGMGILQGLHRVRAFHALRVVLVSVTAGGLGLAAVVDRLDVRSAAAAYLCAYIVLALASIALVARESRGPVVVERDTVRRLARFGWRAHTSTVASIFNERLDQLVISIFLAPAKLGLYVVAVTLTSLTSAVGSSVALVAMPAIARLQSTAERAQAAARFVRVTIYLSALVTVPVFLLATPLVAVFFGDEFAEAVAVARVLLVAGVVLTTGRALVAILKGAGVPLAAGIADLSALVVTVVGLSVLMPAFGLLGAAVASLVAYGVSTALMVRAASRTLDVSVWSLLAPRFRAKALRASTPPPIAASHGEGA